MKIHLLIFSLIIGASTVLKSQIDTILHNMPVNTCIDEEVKINTDYIIRVNGVDYTGKDRIYICESELMDTIIIEVLYASDLSPVQGMEWDWSAGDAEQLDENLWQGFLIKSLLQGGDKGKIKVQFIENKESVADYGNLVKLEAGLWIIASEIDDDDDIDHKETRKRAFFAYDKNDIANYPFYGTGVPWKFLLTHDNDKLVLEGHKDAYRQDVFTVSPYPGLDVEVAGNEIDLLYTGNHLRDSLGLHICDEDTLAIIDVFETVKVIPAYIWTFRESDDDMINYCLTDNSKHKDCVTPITSDTFQCILPGADGTFDMYLASAQDQSWIDTTQDSVYGYQKLYMKVMAGSDHACQSTTMRGTNTDTPDTLMPAPVFNMDSLMAWTNHIYEKVGIQFQFTDYGEHHKNFDILDDDNAAIFKEARELTLQYPFTEGWPINTSLRIYIFPNLVDPSVQGGGYSTLRGQAPKEGMFVMLDGNLMAERTLAHEIGHAVFGLVHQNEKTEDNDPAKDRINGVVTNDNYNLMTSGSGAASGKARDQKIRRYAWEKIRKANVE